MKLIPPFAAAALSLALNAQADNASARAKLNQAHAEFAQRAQTSNVDNVIKLLDDASLDADDPTLAYEIYSSLAWAYNFKGEFFSTEKNNKVALFEKGMEAAKNAMGERKDLGEAPYWYAVNLARWALARGILESLFRKDELMAHLNKALSLPALNGAPTQLYDGHGPERVLGRMYLKLPGWAGGNHNKSLEILSRVANAAPTYGENPVYLAEILTEMGGDANKARARAILDELLAKVDAQGNPTLNVERMIETKAIFHEARQLRARLTRR